MICAGVIGLSYYVYAEQHLRPLKERAEAIACRSNLKQLGLAATVWTFDRERQLYPTNFAMMRDAIATPRLLVCPADTANPMREVNDWSAFDCKFSSYEVLAPGLAVGSESRGFARCKRHGIVCDGTGSVIVSD